MKSRTGSALGAVAVLTLLAGCATNDAYYGSSYYGAGGYSGAYYGGAYYDGYYGDYWPDYYYPGLYGYAFIPGGGYGGRYYRGDRDSFRRGDGRWAGGQGWSDRHGGSGSGAWSGRGQGAWTGAARGSWSSGQAGGGGWHHGGMSQAAPSAPTITGSAPSSSGSQGHSWRPNR